MSRIKEANDGWVRQRYPARSAMRDAKVDGGDHEARKKFRRLRRML